MGLAKLVKDFVLCLVENILVWPIKKLMPPEWLMKLAKQMELNQKTKFLHPKSKKVKKARRAKKVTKKANKKRTNKKASKTKKAKKIVKRKKINKFVTFQEKQLFFYF